jgi:tetratricopeptide (TPR) repeat protein
MKIGIYAICKNEAPEIKAWLANVKDADAISVVDTGSTDGGWKRVSHSRLALRHGAILPWRFDDAFNMALNLLPSYIDVAIRLDFDERLSAGWRDAIEKAWNPVTTRLRYPYVWNWKAEGVPDRHWWGDRIHARAGYRWSGVTHEGLMCRGVQVETFTRDFNICQYPRSEKPRPNDLPMLEEAVRENSSDIRMQAYLAREYAFRGQPDDAILTAAGFIASPLRTSDHRLETLMALQTLAHCDPEERAGWLRRAVTDVPDHREPLVALAQHYHDKGAWNACYGTALEALEIETRPESYMCTAEAWGARPWDLAAVAAWNLKEPELALKYAKKALELEPNDLRLQSNYAIMAKLTAGEHKDVADKP